MKKLIYNGVALAYKEAGSGDPPMLLVHGFAGNHTQLAPQFDYFRQNHRVVTVDRRGHGESDKPKQDYTIQQFADDLAWMCGELRLKKPVVIVHSQDKIAFDLAARYPDLPLAVVIIDGPTFPPPQLATAFEGVLEGFRSPGYQEALRQLAENAVFLPNDNSEQKVRIINDLISSPQHVIVSTWENYLAYDISTAVTTCQTPLLFIQSYFPANVDRLRELCPHVVIERTTGAGHFSQLEVPDQVNTIIERFLLTIKAPKTAPAGL